MKLNLLLLSLVVTALGGIAHAAEKTEISNRIQYKTSGSVTKEIYNGDEIFYLNRPGAGFSFKLCEGVKTSSPMENIVATLENSIEKQKMIYIKFIDVEFLAGPNQRTDRCILDVEQSW